MNNRVVQRAHELMAQGVPFALATVVRRERPTSGQPGDKAIITHTGEFVGWIGGVVRSPPCFRKPRRLLRMASRGWWCSHPTSTLRYARASSSTG